MNINQFISSASGTQVELQLSSLITRDVVKLDDNQFEIHDTSCGWTSAIVDAETLLQITTGVKSLLDIEFN